MKKISTLYALLALLLFSVACQKSELKSKTEETTEEEIVLQLRQQADSCGVQHRMDALRRSFTI